MYTWSATTIKRRIKEKGNGTNEQCILRVCECIFFPLPFAPCMSCRICFLPMRCTRWKSENFTYFHLIIHNRHIKRKLRQIITLSLNIWQTTVHTTNTYVFIQPTNQQTNTHTQTHSFCTDIWITQSTEPFIKVLKMTKLFACLLFRSFSLYFSPALGHKRFFFRRQPNLRDTPYHILHRNLHISNLMKIA